MSLCVSYEIVELLVKLFLCFFFHLLVLPSKSNVCSLLLDNERWKQAEVPAEFQDLVNSIADGKITLPERKIPGPEKPRPELF